MKKKVGGIELRPEAFAFVPDPSKPHLWKLPIYHPDRNRELNLVLSAVKRFGQTDIPAEIRAAVWHRITQQAVRLHVSFPARMPIANLPRKPPHHVQANQYTQKLSNEEKQAKEIIADAALRAERLLEALGFSESD